MLSDPLPRLLLPPLWFAIRAGQHIYPYNASNPLYYLRDCRRHQMLPWLTILNEMANICAIVLIFFCKYRVLNGNAGVLRERKVLHKVVARVKHIKWWNH